MSGSPPPESNARATELRDLFLLSRVISAESMKVEALTYDAVVATVGPPGTGYDPSALFTAAYEAGREPRRLFAEASKRGTEALKAEGWLP